MQSMPEGLSGLAPKKPRAETAVGRMVETPEDQPAPGQEVASPEEQKQYEEFVAVAMMPIWQKGIGDKLMQSMKRQKDPRAGVATITSNLVMRTMEAAKQEKRKIGMDVLYAAIESIAEQVMERASAEGIHDFAQDPEMARGAAIRAFDETRAKLVEAKLISVDELKQDFEDLKQADEEGTLEQRMRGEMAAEAAAEGAAPAGKPERGTMADDESGMSRQQRRRARRRASKRARKEG